MPLRVGVIVEGEGEYHSIRTLLERIWYELLRGDYIEVLKPIRRPQGTLLKVEGLMKAADAAKIMLGPDVASGPRTLVLILIDAESRCPKELAPKLVTWAKEARADADIACVMPNPMFETWFASAAASLAGVNGLPEHLTTPDDPEGKRLGKRWLKAQLRRKYQVTVDQPRLAAKFDLAECRARSASFDKLCRELARRLPPTDE
jgi:hypothetical protein